MRPVLFGHLVGRGQKKIPKGARLLTKKGPIWLCQISFAAGGPGFFFFFFYFRDGVEG